MRLCSVQEKNGFIKLNVDRNETWTHLVVRDN